MGKVTWAQRIDHDTGRPVENPDIRYRDGKSVIWPSVLGAHNWMPMAFNPDSGLAYIPYMQLGMRFTKAPEAFHGVTASPVYADERDGKGALVAWDPVAQKQRWRVDHDWLWNGGTLTTAGGLVFQGTADGVFSAYNAETGERLWHFNAGLGIISQPIAYALDGVQYIALLVGYGAPNPYQIPTMNPGWKFNAQPRRLLVFKLDGTAKLPPTAPPSWEVNAVDDPSLALNPADVAAGRQLFSACAGCHGGGAESAGAPGPDLRESPIALNVDALYRVLHEGAFLRSGMPRYEELTREDVRQLHAYIRDRARAAINGDSGEPVDYAGPR